jgi:putative transposase
MRLRKPNRLKYYDYSQAGWYYITTCTKDHKNHFCKITNEKMIFNRYGQIVDECWKNIENLHENIELDYYVIMPNHIHGIIIINVGDENLSSQSKKKGNQKIRNATLQSRNAKFAFPTDRTKMVLSKIIQQFKRAVTIRIKSVNQNSTFKWQRSFYERIIRNEKELFEIRKYIQQNPLKWDLEKHIVNLDF